METVFKNFYRHFYMRTGGFIPCITLNQHMGWGDFFQIRNGRIVVLGNIFRNNIVGAEDIQIGYGSKQNPAGWNFADSVFKPYSGRGNGQNALEGEFQFSKQVMAFSGTGSFIFKANDPESVKIMNWDKIQQQLIVKLTQTIYSFRELYVVTETAVTSVWTLAIAGADNAELEIAIDAENFAQVDIFGMPDTKTIQSKNIEFYQQEWGKKTVCFKAKKLAVAEEMVQLYISQAEDDPAYTLPVAGYSETCTLDMLPACELNAPTAWQYFKWTDAGQEDIDRLF